MLLEKFEPAGIQISVIILVIESLILSFQVISRLFAYVFKSKNYTFSSTFN